MGIPLEECTPSKRLIGDNPIFMKEVKILE